MAERTVLRRMRRSHIGHFPGHPEVVLLVSANIPRPILTQRNGTPSPQRALPA